MSGINDLTYAFRQYRNSRVVALVVVASIGLGIGVNTLVFTVLNAMLLKPLAGFTGVESLVLVSQRDRAGLGVPVSYLELQEWRARQDCLEDIAGYDSRSLTVTGLGDPISIMGARVTEDFFRVMKTEPLMGRAFSAEEFQAGRDGVVVIGESVWRHELEGDRRALGSVLMVDGRPRVLVGIMGPGLRFPSEGVWIPLVPERNELQPGFRNLGVIARRRPGAGTAQVRAQLGGIGARLAQQSGSRTESDVQVRELTDLLIGGNLKRSTLCLGFAVACVLLIACVNVAGVKLSRLAARRKELAIRAAVGGNRSRLVRQLLVEAAVLAASGGALGLALAHAGLVLLRRLELSDLPYWFDLKMDSHVLMFAGAASVLSGIVFGVAPALEGSRVDLASALKDAGNGSMGGSRSSRLVALCTVVEVSISFLLLSGAALATHNLRRLQSVPLGFETEDRVSALVNLPDARYPAGARGPFFNELLRRVQAMPGTASAALVTPLPLTTSSLMSDFNPDDRPRNPGSELPTARLYLCTPDYFETMGIPLSAGRAFSPGEAQARALTVVVSRSLARRYWQKETAALGHVVGLSGSPFTIVGVAADVRHGDLEQAAGMPAIYLPLSFLAPKSAAVVVRARPGARGIERELRSEIRRADSQVVAKLARMDDLAANQTADARKTSLILSVLAGVAVLIASVGLYGIISDAVVQRLREIAIRRALGAGNWSVLVLVARRSLLLCGLGIAAGAAAAGVLGRLAAASYYLFRDPDWVVAAEIAVVLLLTTALAAAAPMSRALRLNPNAVLRHE